MQRKYINWATMIYSFSSGAEKQTQLSKSTSAGHVFNTVNKFPTGNTNPQSQANVPSARQKAKLKKKGKHFVSLCKIFVSYLLTSCFSLALPCFL